MNLEILKRMPNLDTKVLLSIRPLAPLSMVSDMPGAFYKTLIAPNKKMLCGLFENLLDWQFSLSNRVEIWKDYKKIRKSHNSEVKKYPNGSSFLPLLMDYFDMDGEFKIKEFKSKCIYKDLWDKGYRRADGSRHINGCRNIDINIMAEYYDNFAALDGKSKDNWFKDHIGSFPYFYASPTSREFISLDGTYQFHLLMDRQLYVMLNDIQVRRNIGYLGTTEGWVDVNLRLL